MIRSDDVGACVESRREGMVGPIYLDYHATTPVDPRVAEVVAHCMLVGYGNASSVDHSYGDAAAEAVDRAAVAVANLVGGSADEIMWTSGATEAINLCIAGFAAARGESGPLRLVVSPTEHAAVLATCAALARAGRATMRLLHVDSYGRVDLDEVDTACRAGADLLCIPFTSRRLAFWGKLMTHRLAVDLHELPCRVLFFKP